MSVQWLVMAKAPAPGKVKTRLCPPCTPVQAARLAEAALADTLRVIGAAAAGVRTLVLSGSYPAPAGWRVVAQRGDGLAGRLHHAFGDTRRPGTASLLVGMDTPQLTPGLVRAAATALTVARVDAVLGPAEDGGWWALGLRDPAHADVLRAVPTSTAHTGTDTIAALRGRGLRVGLLPVLRDVDTADDAAAVARLCLAGSRFAGAVAAHLPARVGQP
jgi:rSAM/selenodomain-associated transferase 1